MAVKNYVNIKVGVEPRKLYGGNTFYIELDPLSEFSLKNSSITLPYLVSPSSDTPIAFYSNARARNCSSIFITNTHYETKSQLEKDFMDNCEMVVKAGYSVKLFGDDKILRITESRDRGLGPTWDCFRSDAYDDKKNDTAPNDSQVMREGSGWSYINAVSLAYLLDSLSCMRPLRRVRFVDLNAQGSDAALVSSLLPRHLQSVMYLRIKCQRRAALQLLYVSAVPNFCETAQEHLERLKWELVEYDCNNCGLQEFNVLFRNKNFNTTEDEQINGKLIWK
jgi:hypothetical protein